MVCTPEHPSLGYRSQWTGATRWLAAGWAGIAALSSGAIADEREAALCPGIVVRGDLDPGLSDAEKRLVCGDPEAGPGGAWKSIPDPQARYGIRNFLQDRGYHSPVFSRQGDTLIVELGPLARVTRFEIVGAPPEVEADRRRKIVGEKLTPQILGTAEGWVKTRLEGIGYPCPKLETEADPQTGILRVKVETGPLQNLVEITEPDLPGIQPGVLRRYDSFVFGEPFSSDMLRVAENRVTQLGLFQSIHYTARCGEKGAIVRQDIVAGSPRLIRLGVGLDTEGVVRGRAIWRNARLGAMASAFDVTALGSAKEQRVDVTFNWYFRDLPSRQSLRPLAQLAHSNEEFYETLEARGQFAFTTTYDSHWLGLQLTSGPTLDQVVTLEGVGPANSRFVSWETRLDAQTHYHELYLSSPRTGWQTSVGATFNSRDVLSTVTAQRLFWEGRALVNFREHDPPLWVFGGRWGFRTLVTGEGLEGIPPTFRQYLGGTADMRGFGRQALPGPLGAITSAYVGLEARLAATLPIGLEPFLFYDFGMTGPGPVALDEPLYRSPGFGIRWASPIGPIRTTFARGLASSRPAQWQFYFSYGEEF